MRYLCAVLVTALVAFSSEKASAAPFADTICPVASQYVIAVGGLKQSDPPDKIYDAAQAATNAYERCSNEKLSNGFREPQHYADTRASQFAVLAARALIQMNRLDEARRELEHWRAMAQQVVDWKSETVAYASADVNGEAVTQNSDKRSSLYQKSAKEIVTAIDAELKMIAERSSTAPRREAGS